MLKVLPATMDATKISSIHIGKKRVGAFFRFMSSLVSHLRSREKELVDKGFKYIVGTDEAGRGALAGPVVAAACYIPHDVVIQGVNDSKSLNLYSREECFKQLTSNPEILTGVSILDNEVIDRENIQKASLRAMVESVSEIGKENVDYVLVDGNRDPPFEGIPFETVVKGDQQCYCIAAASIIAKVTRDRIMEQLHEEYPLYGFAQHKGYPTAVHRSLIFQYGPCLIHRKTFSPIKHMSF